MEFGYNKNLTLYLRTQYQPNMETKLGKSKKNNPRGYTEVETFTTITHRKNQVMLSKIWYLTCVEKPPADIIQNIRKGIQDFLWNCKKFRVNSLVIMDIETQREAIQCFILAKLSKVKYQNKTWTDLML